MRCQEEPTIRAAGRWTATCGIVLLASCFALSKPANFRYRALGVADYHARGDYNSTNLNVGNFRDSLYAVVQRYKNYQDTN